ncbi:MAG: 4-hydroxy-3-methylbut-2-enyl diphosphate reductase [Candidatus Brocadiaceae bacterium]|jgi:4-hydroxy-3-methylbut-2-enyl diphosphate reductase
MCSHTFEIVVAETAGFCMGVQRAVRMVLDAAEDPGTVVPIRTPGSLIHNRQVLEVLERRGILAMDDSDSSAVGTGVVRAHGLSRQGQEELRRRCGELLDATCPHVRRVQEIVEEHARKGYLCVVVGDEGHAEVEAVLSYSDGRGYLVRGPEEIADLPPAEKVVVVAQTTQDEDVFRAAVEEVRRRYGRCLAFDTICRSTGLRQAEARQLSRRVDAMIVVGGYNSANTRRLAEISSAAGTPTYHVETERDLDVNEILQYETVGLTAGASTPNWMIRRVILRLQNEYRRRTRPLRHLARTALMALVFTNLYTAGAVAALTFAAAHLLGRMPELLPACMLVSFFFVLSQQLLNQYGRRESLYLSEPARSEFFMANEGPLLALSIGAGLVSVVLAYLLGPWVFGLLVMGSLGGAAYQLKLPRALAAPLGLRSLEQIPGSKEIFVGLAWGALAAVVPALLGGVELASAATAFAACFLMAFQRTLALDLRDVEADQLVGRETLVRFLGPGRASGLFFCLVTLEAVVLLVGGVAGWITSLSFGLLVAVAYAVLCSVVLHRKRLDEEVAEALVDGQFYLVGLLSLAWGLAG